MAELYRHEELTPLTSQETFSFIFEQSKFLLIGYPAKTVDRIWELTAGHPYYIQLLYDETLNYAFEEGRQEIDLTTLDEVLPLILEKSPSDFIRLTANLGQPALDTLAASAVAFRQQQPITPASVSAILDQSQRPLAAKELADIFNELQKGAILRRDEWGGFTFIIPLMAYWLLQQYPLKTSDLVISPVSRSQSLQPKWLMLGGSGVMIILLLFVGWRRLDSSLMTTADTSAAVAFVPPSDTLTPPPTATPTATARPISITTATLIPTQPAASDPLPTVTPPPTSTPTETTAPTLTPPPTATPLPTLTPAPVATSIPTLSPPPTATSTALAPLTPTPSLPAGEFTLLNPVALDQPSYGFTEFEWQWAGAVPAGTGFEVRVWREGEPQTGVHDALFDNQNGKIESLGENKYRLRVDITGAAGVQGFRGEYWWTVALVQVSPGYADLGQQAPPARMRFEPKGGGGGSSGGDTSGGGGGGGVGVD